MTIEAKAIRYGDNIDTDVIIPARYLTSSDPKELARTAWRTWTGFLKKLPENGVWWAGPTSAAAPPASTRRWRSSTGRELRGGEELRAYLL